MVQQKRSGKFNSRMARTCLIAAICAGARRSSNIRVVSAFQMMGSSSTSTNNYVATNSALFMSTTAPKESATSILKRVKTAEAEPSDEIVAVKGWVRTVRKQKTLAFVEVNDGSSLSGIQCVLPFDSIDESTQKGSFNK